MILNTPKLSVCMITYNHENYIREAIEGVLMQQTDFSVELVISNDRSTDETDKIIKEYVENHPKGYLIRYFNQAENLGMMPNFIFTLQQCEGEYVALCEGDDYWTDPLKLQKQVDFLEGNTEYIVCYHNAIVVDSNSNKIKESLLYNENKVSYKNYDLKRGVWILPLTMCFRNIIKEFPPEFSKVFNGDTFLISLLGCYGDGKWIDDILPAAYRMHAGGVWSSKTNYQKRIPQINTYSQMSNFYKRKKDKRYEYYFIEKRFKSGMFLLKESFRLASFKLILKSYLIVLFQCRAILSFSKTAKLNLTIFKIFYYKIKYNKI